MRQLSAIPKADAIRYQNLIHQKLKSNSRATKFGASATSLEGKRARTTTISVLLHASARGWCLITRDCGSWRQQLFDRSVRRAAHCGNHGRQIACPPAPPRTRNLPRLWRRWIGAPFGPIQQPRPLPRRRSPGKPGAHGQVVSAGFGPPLGCCAPRQLLKTLLFVKMNSSKVVSG